MSGLRDRRAAARDEAAANAEAALRLPRLRGRLDAGLGLVLIAALAIMGALGWVAASQIRAAGWFAPPLVSEVDDPRILDDYRDNASPMVDLLVAGNDLLIGRKDGTLDRFSLSRRTFATEALPRDGLLAGGLALLSAPCDGEDCGPPAGVHAVTDRGGIALRQGGHWRTLLADVAFIGADGQPVEQAQLRGWAASDDGTLVLLDAGAQGIGLFDQRVGSWRTGRALPGEVQGPLFYGGAFWIGGTDGLYRLDPAAADLVPPAPLEGAQGTILSLALSESDGLLALHQGPCADGGAGCLSLLKMDPRGRAQVLMAEAEANPDLNDAGLFHVALQSGDLVAIGSAGAYRYETAARHWRAIERQEPTAWFAEAEGRRIHVAVPGRVLTIEGAGVKAEVRIDAPVVQILPGDSGTLYGLDRAGRILSLTPPEARVLAPADTGAPEGTRFDAALRLGDRLVAIGRTGILVHDMKARRYSFTPASALPPLPPADALLRGADADSLWVVGRRDGAVWRMTPGGEFPSLAISLERLGVLNEAVREARPSGASLDLVAESGQVFRVAPDGSAAEPLIGAPLAGTLVPRAMAAGGRVLLFTNGREIHGYDKESRGWLDPLPGPPGAPLDDITVAGGRIVGLARDGRLWTWEPDGDWSRVSGGAAGAAFASADVTDALMENGTLFLAADGQVQSYLPAERHFGDRWSAAGEGGRLLGVTGGVPVWTTSRGIFHGSTPEFTPPGFLGAWPGASGPVALVESGGRRYATDPGGCLYLGVAPPEGALRDVVDIGGGRLLVRSDTGAGLYEPDLHRWLGVTGLGSGPQTRLMALSGHLVRLDADTLRSVPLSAIPVGGACDVSAVAIDWTVTEGGRAVSLVDGAPEVLVLGRDGALRRWRAGTVEEVAPPPGDGPSLEAALRVYLHGERIELLTADALWSYDLARRQWSSRAFVDAPARIVQIDMARGEAGVTLSAWDGEGQLWAGSGETPAGSIRFTRPRLPVLPVLPFPANELRDMAMIGNDIAVLTERRLLIYPAGEETARLDVALPPPGDGWRIEVDGEGKVILTDGPEGAPGAIYRLDPTRHGRADLEAIAARYLPGSDTAHAFTIRAGTVELVRIDAALNTWRCTLRAGDGPACDLLTPAPLVLAPEEIRAWDQPARILLADRDLLRLDNASRVSADISGPQITPKGVLFHSGPALMFWEGPGRGLWHLSEGGAGLVLPQVETLRQLPDSLQALAGGKVLGIANGAVIDDTLPARGDGRTTIGSHYTADGLVWRLDNGGAVALNGTLASDPVLDFGSDARSVLPFGTATDGTAQWWLREGADGSLARVAATGCDDPGDALSAASPPQFTPPQPPPARDKARCMTTLPLATALAPGERVIDIDTGAILPRIVTNRHVWRLEGDILVDPQPLPEIAIPRDLAEARPPHPFGAIDGVSFLNPPTIRDGRLHGGATVQSLNLLHREVPPAFDNGWLAWLREDGQFRMATSDGTALLAPGNAFPGGRFRALHEGRGAMLGDGETSMWLSPRGLWSMRDGRLALVSDSARGLPEALDDGRFLMGGTALAVVDGTPSPAAQPRRVTVGPLSFEISAAPMRVRATVEVDGQPAPAGAPRGFAHDLRLAAAQTGGEAFYLTPAGLVPAGRLAALRGVPADTDRLEAEAGRLFLRTPGGWLQVPAGGGAWVAGPAPFLNQELARENGRVWSRRDGAILPEPEDSRETWRVARQGLDFDIDRLIGLAATPGQTVAVTRAGTVAAADLSGLRGQHPPLAPAPPALPIDALRAGPSQHVVFSRGVDGQAHIWDATAATWRPPLPQERVWEHRLAVSDAGMTVSFAPQPGMTVAAQEAGGGEVTLPFGWARGEEMPFDRATALFSEEGGPDLLVGTGLGLRRLVLRGDRFVNDALTIPAGAPSAGWAVAAVGRPMATPARIEAAFADGTCLESAAASQPMRPCGAAQGLDRRLVTADAHWEWVETASGVEGRYLLAGGGGLPVPQPLTGRLPHDRLADRLDCGGTTFERWLGMDIVLAGDRLEALPGLQSLFCLQEAAQLGSGTTLAPDLHARVTGGAMRFDGSAFVPVTADEVRGLDDRIAGRIVADHSRLRYGLADGALTTEVRGLDDLWQPTPWSKGRLLLDQPRHLAFRDGLQGVTAAGVVMIPGGRLDPERLIVMDGANPGSIAGCDARKVEALDGRSHGLAREGSAPLRLYCRDGGWLEGITDGQRDRGTFVPVTPSESGRNLIDVPGMWSVTRTVTPSGESGAPAIAFRDEPARLAAGRFDFDTIEAIAAPFAGQTELLAASGWWRSPAGVPALAETWRPAGAFDPHAVVALSRDLPPRGDGGGHPGLCLEAEDGTARFWDGGRAATTAPGCRDLRGSDPLWHWWQAGNGPLATATARNGVPLERRLKGGRFTDLVVTGAPMQAPDGTLMAPTGAGVLSLPPGGGQPLGIHAFPEGGALARGRTGAVLRVAHGGVSNLAGTSLPAATGDLRCEGLATLAASLPETVRILKVSDASPGLAGILLGQGDAVTQALVDCASGGALPWAGQHEVSGHPRRRGIGDDAPGTVRISLGDDTVRLEDETRALSLPTLLRKPRGLAASPGGREVLVMDGRQLWSIDLGRAIELLAVAPPKPAPGPDPDAGTAPAVAALPEATASDTPTAEVEAPEEAPPDSSPPAPTVPASAQAADEAPMDMRAVQEAVGAALGTPLAVDGIAGPRTRAAIAAWQAMIGAEETGYLSDAQLRLLLGGEP